LSISLEAQAENMDLSPFVALVFREGDRSMFSAIVYSQTTFLGRKMDQSPFVA